jgi:hypothetical protein
MKDQLAFKQDVNHGIGRSRGIMDLFDLRGKFHVEQYREGDLIYVDDFPNGITNVGKNKILDEMFNGATQIPAANWYIGLIDLSGYSTVAAGDTMSSHGGWLEFTGYTESPDRRVGWGPGAASSQSTTNASPATFDVTGTGTVKGVFVVGDPTASNAYGKSGTTGTLWATALFSADVAVANGDQLKVTYTVSA